MEMSSVQNAIQLEEGEKRLFKRKKRRVKGERKQEGKMRQGGEDPNLHSSIYNHSGSEQPHSKCQKALFKTSHLKLNVVFSHPPSIPPIDEKGTSMAKKKANSNM